MYRELLLAILTPVVAFALRWFFTLIGFEMDDGTFMALVGAIVLWFINLFLGNVARKANPTLF